MNGELIEWGGGAIGREWNGKVMEWEGNGMGK